ncbi:MAG: 3-oxoacid CoA-transferase subunit B [Parasporobacterium sp.]|nr:3-oxoacid CoA-transferase subunit B [Parasporobacterium sp.]
MASVKEIIAHRVAQDLKDGYVVNLGIGLPTMVADYVPEGIEITIQSENGMVGMAGVSAPDEIDVDVINSGGVNVNVEPGAVFFDSSTSFGIIRGGHVDMTVLGALQVDQEGNLASHIIPGKMASGMGGAMDLVVGAKEVIIAMVHTQKGTHKLLEKIALPTTAVNCVNKIITEMGVIDIVPGKGMVLRELAPGVSFDDIQAATGCTLHVEGEIKTMVMPPEA